MRIKKVLWLLIGMGMLTLCACGPAQQTGDVISVTPVPTVAAEQAEAEQTGE